MAAKNVELRLAERIIEVLGRFDTNPEEIGMWVMQSPWIIKRAAFRMALRIIKGMQLDLQHGEFDEKLDPEHYRMCVIAARMMDASNIP